jgi:hypothetical protein
MTDIKKLRNLIHVATKSAKPIAARTGATARIEPMLPDIRELRAENYTWETIAEGLTALGLYQVNRETGQSEPLTGRRLSALITAIDKKAARHAARNTARSRRKDLLPPLQTGLRLSPDLVNDKVATVTRRTATEQDIRVSALKDLQAMMRRD